MTRHDFGAVVLLVLIAVVFVGIPGMVAGVYIARSALCSQLVERGLKEYDRSTGKLVWTEKAGGEKGGGK